MAVGYMIARRRHESKDVSSEGGEALNLLPCSPYSMATVYAHTAPQETHEMAGDGILAEAPAKPLPQELA